MCSSPSVSYVPPTPEERELDIAERKRIEQEIAQQRAEAAWRRRQLDLWDKYYKQYMAEEEALQPLRLEAMGLRRVDRPEGGYTYERYTPEPRSETERTRREIERIATQNQLAALRGEAYSPAVEESIRKGEQELEERMTRDIGPGWRTTTPGLEALARQKREADILRSAMRRGELTALEDAARAATGALGTEQASRLAELQAPSQNVLAMLSTLAEEAGGGRLGQLPRTTGYSSILNRMLGERATRAEIAAQNAINAASIRRQNTAAALGLVGSIIGGIFGGIPGAAIGGATGSAIGQSMVGHPSVQRVRPRRY